MPHRYKQKSPAFLSLNNLQFFSALRAKFKEGYNFRDFRSDLMAGLVVAMVAIPLGMALAIASGVAPQYGLYTVIIGGGIVALIGGSRFQVTGPTAAFVVILFPIVQKFGLSGLLISGFLAGIILFMMGFARMGRIIQFIPYPVTTGFTSGIAIVIAILQLKDFFGLKLTGSPEHFWEKVWALFEARNTASLGEFLVSFSTLAILVLWPKINKKIPAPLMALSIMTVVTILVQKMFPDFEISTIGSRFSYNIDGIVGKGIPQTPPFLKWPWDFVGINGRSFSFSFATVKALIPSAFSIALLGAIESLLSAVVADGMGRTKHNPDAELIALGIGNIICPFFGGIPATGAIARTATNIRYGARSPIAAILHALITLLVILLFAPYVSFLPMASLSALLILVAYNMSEYKHFFHIVKVAPKSDVTVLLLCFGLTVMFDMVVGVTVGVLLAALLFMRRMAEVTEGYTLGSGKKLPAINERIPHDIIVYQIAGPLFFGAAGKAANTLVDISDQVKAVIFLMSEVPVMDVTGLVALEGAIEKLRYKGIKVSLAGLQVQPRELFLKSNLFSVHKDILLSENLEVALKILGANKK